MGDMNDPQALEDAQANAQEQRIAALEQDVTNLKATLGDFFGTMRSLYGKDQLNTKYGAQFEPYKDFISSAYPGMDPFDEILKAHNGDWNDPKIESAVTNLIGQFKAIMDKIRGPAQTDGTNPPGTVSATVAEIKPDGSEPPEAAPGKPNVDDMLDSIMEGVGVKPKNKGGKK